MALGLLFCRAAFVLGSAGGRFGLFALGRIFHEAVVGFVGLAGGAFAGWHGGCWFVVCDLWLFETGEEGSDVEMG
jgi:hypothetical protein